MKPLKLELAVPENRLTPSKWSEPAAKNGPAKGPPNRVPAGKVAKSPAISAGVHAFCLPWAHIPLAKTSNPTTATNRANATFHLFLVTLPPHTLCNDTPDTTLS